MPDEFASLLLSMDLRVILYLDQSRIKRLPERVFAKLARIAKRKPRPVRFLDGNTEVILKRDGLSLCQTRRAGVRGGV